MSADQAALILYRLDELKGSVGYLSKRFDKVEEKLEQKRLDTERVKVTSGICGGRLAGALAAAGTALAAWFVGR